MNVLEYDNIHRALEPVAARHNVVERAGEFDADLACHGGGWRKNGRESTVTCSLTPSFLQG